MDIDIDINLDIDILSRGEAGVLAEQRFCRCWQLADWPLQDLAQSRERRERESPGLRKLLQGLAEKRSRQRYARFCPACLSSRFAICVCSLSLLDMLLSIDVDSTLALSPIPNPECCGTSLAQTNAIPPEQDRVNNDVAIVGSLGLQSPKKSLIISGQQDA